MSIHYDTWAKQLMDDHNEIVAVVYQDEYGKRIEAALAFVEMLADPLYWQEIGTQNGDTDFVFRHKRPMPQFNGPLHERANAMLRGKWSLDQNIKPR